MAPFAQAAQRLETIPGVSQRVAETVVAEIGVDMMQFPCAGHLASWAGMCSGNHETPVNAAAAASAKETAG